MHQSKYGARKLYKVINEYLKKPTPQPPIHWRQFRHLVFDGTFLHRPQSLVALLDARNHELVAGQYGIAENSPQQLRGFLAQLAFNGLQPRSFTVDGNPHVVRALKDIWPEVTIQRCLVHIQRQGLSWCRMSPRTNYARDLRKIFLAVTKINTVAERDAFLRLVTAWETTYGSQISARHERGHVFSDIKRARSMLLRALPDMFHYLDDSSIPFSTNGLESYFSRLKAHYRQHRGLTLEKRQDYFRWYFYFVPK